MKKRLWAIPVVAILAVISGALAHLGSVRANANTALETRESKTAAAAKPSATGRVVLYAAVGAELTQYDVDVNAATLAKRGSLTLPAGVQEAVQAPSRQYLYIAWSNGGPSNVAQDAVAPRGSQHGLSAFRIDPASGALHPNGAPAPLPSRPIHVTTDVPGTHVLAAYNDPSGVTVHEIQPDGAIGRQVAPAAPLDVGIYGHQVRVDPSNQMVILVTRGNGPTATKPEDPGALKIFGYKDGVLTNRLSIAPGGGFNFQSRHLDFHPSRPWVFLSLERQNKLDVFERLKDGTLSRSPLFSKDTLTEPSNVRPGQALGTIHVHPNGKFVYLANRASGTTDFQGKSVFVGGENSIAVFSINENTGEPTLIQNVDTRGIHVRTFALDPSGRLLVAANMMQLSVREGNGLRAVPASLAVFRVRADGKLDFVRKYDVDAGGRNMWWMGMMALP